MTNCCACKIVCNLVKLVLAPFGVAFAFEWDLNLVGESHSAITTPFRS
jgi:hypothetical protein